MKKFLFFSLLSLSVLFVTAQPNWTLLQGDAYSPGFGIYGIKGVASPINKPGARSGQVTWKDAAGDIWMFGGIGTSANNTEFLNDLWKYSSATGQWTWINGDPVADQPGAYNTKGVPSRSNNIRPRANPAHWLDRDGNLWIFGGDTYRFPEWVGVPFYLNDLWKYTPATNIWTWMGGDSLYFAISTYRAVYGTKGVAAPTSKPGSKSNAVTWIDGSGDLWLFGGQGQTNSFIGGTGDLWKYGISTGLWTWMGGDTLIEQPGRFGTKGVSSALNKPPSKVNSTSWLDKAGNVWLYGGTKSRAGASQNDLWTYVPSINQWTWVSGDSTTGQAAVYGSKKIPSVNNKPGAGSGAAEITDSSGNFWLYGGTPAPNLWKYAPASGEWTWVNGDSASGSHPPVYGQPGILSDTAHPGAGGFTATWTDASGNLYFNNTNIIWKYAPASDQWAWIQGDTTAVIANLYTYTTYPRVFGNKGIAAAANSPGSRQFGATWRDASGMLWLYGGSTYSPGGTSSTKYFQDLWKYAPSTGIWTWVSGDSAYNKQPNYGSQGIASDTSTPGSRSNAATWTDASGNLWLFGGLVNSTNGANSPVETGDLWKYTVSTGQWTWITGGLNISGIYYSTTPQPGSRFNTVTWTDASGNFWLYGGQGNAATYFKYIFSGYFGYGKLNDLWKYTPTTGKWAFIRGDTITNPSGDHTSQLGIYGSKGITAVSNQPGGRSAATGWLDPSGNFWMFGGVADVMGTSSLVEAYLNDLWMFSPSTSLWTWMSGNNTFYNQGVYSPLGVAAAKNTPGARKYSTGWTDGTGNLYLFGGTKDTINYTTNYTNDLWEYAVSSGLWTWISGDNAYNQPGFYGTPGVASTSNKPGGRVGSMSWSDGAGSLWLYSGYGYPASGIRYLNDMMKFSTSSSALPVIFGGFTAQQQHQYVLLNWSTAQEQNSLSFIIERSADGVFYSPIGSVAASGTVFSTSRYAFTDLSPLQGNNFYRLKEVDKDNKFMFSGVQKVFMGEEGAHFAIVKNPVQQVLQLSVQLPSAQKLELQVRDAAGHLLSRMSYTAARGNTLVQLAVDRLARGTYFINVHSESLHSTKAFIKQ